MTFDPKKEVLARLEELKVPCQIHDHPPILTVVEGRKIAAGLSSLCCKSLLVKNKKKFFLIVLESNKRFDSKAAAKQISCGHLSFASAEDLRNKLNTFAGAVSLLGLLYNEEKDVQLIFDEDVLKAEHIDCHPCTNDCSLKMSVADIIDKLLPQLGIEYKTIQMA